MEPLSKEERKKRILIAMGGAIIPLAFMGFFFWSFFKDFSHTQPNGGPASKTPLFIFGGFFAVMVLAVVFSVMRGIRKAMNSDTGTPPRDPQPWLKRADWAAGKIKSTATVPVKIMVIVTLAFGGFGGLMTAFVLPKELHHGNYLALLILLFPAVGIGFLVGLIRNYQARRRFGDCYFELAQIPAPLGGNLEGQILVGTRLRLEQGLHLKLFCLRRVTSGIGDNRSTEENILWQDEKIFRPEADLPEPEPGRSGIPVYFKLPANQPEATPDGGDGIYWRLEAKAKMSGPDFFANFDVPVFRVAGAVVVDDEKEAADPTAALQESVEELRREEGSKIEITDGPAGREFYFPAARNPGAAMTTTAFALIFTGVVGLTIHFQAPILFPIITSLFVVILFLAAFSLWFKSSQVTIDSTGVRVVTRWLFFSRTRKFEAGDVARFEIFVGMRSGTQTFQDIKLITNNCADDFPTRKARWQQTGKLPPLSFTPGNPTIASGIASVPEANWLVAEMTKTLGRRA